MKKIHSIIIKYFSLNKLKWNELKFIMSPKSWKRGWEMRRLQRFWYMIYEPMTSVLRTKHMKWSVFVFLHYNLLMSLLNNQKNVPFEREVSAAPLNETFFSKIQKGLHVGTCAGEVSELRNEKHSYFWVKQQLSSAPHMTHLRKTRQKDVIHT